MVVHTQIIEINIHKLYIEIEDNQIITQEIVFLGRQINFQRFKNIRYYFKNYSNFFLCIATTSLIIL
uniref:Uncharacterized protein n=1 Tax=Strongyloides papillosus TaxID=174720 RepID=A0A0N5CIS4_STREA